MARFKVKPLKDVHGEVIGAVLVKVLGAVDVKVKALKDVQLSLFSNLSVISATSFTIHLTEIKSFDRCYSI